jgi:2,3-bisphosphoglycerate-dependent phosphoglycerate mutase
VVDPDGVSLVVIRHAEQERDGQDGPLTARGRRQAATLSAALSLTPADLLVSSSRRRVRETAATIGSALGSAADVVDDLDEYRFGPDWTWQHADDREDLALWRPGDRAGDESLAEFQSRIDRAVESLVDRDPAGRVVLCVHSGVIDAILRWAFGIPPDTAWTTEAVAAHASITELRHWPNGRHPRGAPRFTVLVRMGDVGHLPADLVTGL